MLPWNATSKQAKNGGIVLGSSGAKNKITTVSVGRRIDTYIHIAYAELLENVDTTNFDYIFDIEWCATTQFNYVNSGNGGIIGGDLLCRLVIII